MTDYSPVLGAPQLIPGTPGQEETVNEQLRTVEQGANARVFLSRTTTAQPASPADGDGYLLPAAGCSGDDWTGQDGKIAWRFGSEWKFLDPYAGILAGVVDQGLVIWFDGSAWSPVSGGGGSGLLTFVDSLDASGNPNYPAATKGDAYLITVAGKVGGASGKDVAVGDLVFATADNAGGTEASVGTSWDVLASTFDGLLLAANNLSDLDSAATARSNLGLGTAAVVDVIDEDSFATNSATRPPSQQSVKAYVDALGGGSRKGAIDCSANPDYPEAVAGDWYYVSVAGTIGGVDGPEVSANDIIQCLVDAAEGTDAEVGASWTILDGRGERDFASATKWRILTDAAGSGGGVGWGEAVFLDSGSLQISPVGTASASTEASGNEATEAFDFVTSTGNGWRYDGIEAEVGSWLQFEFSAARSVRSIRMSPITGSYDEAPEEFSLQYYDTVAAGWVSVGSFTTTWPNNNPQTFTASPLAASGRLTWDDVDGDVTLASDATDKIPTVHAVKEYVDTEIAGVVAGSGIQEWVPNFTDDGEVRIYAFEAMTITQQATSGTGSVAYEKSTTAAPGTFSSTTSPITLEAGSWLKVTASAVTTIFAVALMRTD